MRANAATAIEPLSPPRHNAPPAVLCQTATCRKQTGASELDGRPAAASPSSRWVAGRGTEVLWSVG